MENHIQQWSFVRDNPSDVQKAAIKTRILTGCYTLQANRSKFNQYKVDPTCPICKSAPEDRKHFILQCSSTERIRGKYLPKIRNFINESDKNLDLENISRKETFTQSTNLRRRQEIWFMTIISFIPSWWEHAIPSSVITVNFYMIDFYFIVIPNIVWGCTLIRGGTSRTTTTTMADKQWSRKHYIEN